jgi:F420-dependent oxidoreductase-like protein
VETRLPSPCVIVLIGPSSSGKTTWARGNFAATEIVSSDELRSRVGVDEDDLLASKVAFELLESIVLERVKRQLTTVIDTLGLDSERRATWVELAHASDLPIYAVTFPTPAGICLERNSEKQRPLTQSALKKQVKRFGEVLNELTDEGFDSILAERPIRTVAPQLVAAQPGVEERPLKTGHTFGLMVSRFAWGDRQLGPAIADIAQRAEAAGFRDFWVMDHFRQIPTVGRAWEDMPEAYTTLSYVAGVTSTIRLGALVTGITHRNPAVLGKMIATLDVISGGRANAGLGIAWDKEEHAGYGIEFPRTPDRYQLLAESIDVLHLLWGKGTPSYVGEFLSADNLACYPRPIQDQIPIMIGGSGEKKTLRMVAERANAANIFGNPERVAHKVAVLQQHCAAVERDPDEIEVSHLVTVMAAESAQHLNSRMDALRPQNMTREEFARRNNAGIADDLIGLFAGYGSAGATHSIISIPDPHIEGSIEAFGRIIAEMA